MPSGRESLRIHELLNGPGMSERQLEYGGMRAQLLLAAPLLVACGILSLHAQVDPDLQRVRDLVAAGALPRRALAEAESVSLERRYRETLRRTLVSETLEETEIETMLAAAKGLRKLVQERFDTVLTQARAGVLPVKRLQEAKDDLDAAERQAELAQSRADLIRQMERMIATESYLEEIRGDEDEPIRFYGFSDYEYEILTEVSDMFHEAFGRPPPVSAEGETEFHRSIGLDHTGRIDIAVHPDSDEGSFLMYMLENLGIPYIAFRSAVPMQSSGPHIHIGPPSERIGVADSGDFPE